MPRIVVLSNARSGSTYLVELLNCHPDIEVAGEILNDENGVKENPLEAVEAELSRLNATHVGFKLFPDQLEVHGLQFGEMANALGVTHVIVLWREGLLEGYASLQIAIREGVWYSRAKPNCLKTLDVDPGKFEIYTKEIREDWRKIAREWPAGDVKPIFVTFETLLEKPGEETKRIAAELGCPSEAAVFVTPSERQNPAPLWKKITNFDDLDKDLVQERLNVEAIFREIVAEYQGIPENIRAFAPDREPPVPPEGWRYRVAEPYLPPNAIQNALDALNSGSISSAGYWPKELSKRLRALFQSPVAQPCSNGYSALLAALQVANIGEGDSVLVPSMTMVAVPNAVHFLRATPLFADNAPNSYNPSWNEYKSIAEASTKAVIVTHTYGVPVENIQNIADECASRGWTLIEDISECVGVTLSTPSGPRLLGTFGDFAIASLYANKIIHGGDGGFVLAKNPAIEKRLQSIVNHGFTPGFHFVHYEPAPNGKIHGVGAAIACGVFDDLQAVMDHRSQLSKWYRSGLSGVSLKLMPPCGPADTPWVFGVECDSKSQRSQLRRHLALHQIETRDYFFALHLQPAYNAAPPGSLPYAEDLGARGFYLPSHTNLTQLDVQFICSVIQNYFNPEIDVLPAPAKPTIKESVQIAPDSFSVQVNSYRGSGELFRTTTRGHLYLEAVKLGLDAEEALFHEKYDKVHLLLESVQDLLERSSGDPMEKQLKAHFSTFVDYFRSQTLLEGMESPWNEINLEPISRNIPTTTDPETLKLLVWLIQERKPVTIWEIGCWMGHATALMAETSKSAKIFACDAFKWQAWMYNFLQGTNLFKKEGKSFLELFREHLKGLMGQVEAVPWPYDINRLPEILQNNSKPELIYLDITQEDSDLEDIWRMIQNHLIPGETVILFNGLASTSIPFFTRHADQLVALAKPRTMAKAFLFVDRKLPLSPTPAKKSLKFYSSPEWNHHNDNLFLRAVDHLKKHLDGDSGVVFVPAVEETMCNDMELFYSQPWVGIIHSVESHPEFFYTPDLQRLCAKRKYLEAMKLCRGLFTLTNFQADYLAKNLPKEVLQFPIQPIRYPVEMKPTRPSLVPHLLKQNQIVEVLHVGSFARDFDFFFGLQLPDGFQKVLLAGDEDSQNAVKLAPSDVIVIDRLSDTDYEQKLLQSVIFLTLKHEGAANTLILECVSRNIPILSPALSSCIEYLGDDYPLLYDPRCLEQIKSLLTPENITKAIQFLKATDKSKFSYETFLQDVNQGSVMASIPLQPPAKFDITISLCSYKRTHHLPQILESLWSQDFPGSIEIIVWNNNPSRAGIVDKNAHKYIQMSSSTKSLEVITSSKNHYCSIRFAMASIMKGQVLLICDDDVIPGESFVSFFYDAFVRHPQDVLCVRGHEFLPHKLNVQNPHAFWSEYEHLRFRNDDQPEQFLHFVHADACLIPKEALHQIAGEKIPDPTFNLVDDYWMSFILSSKYNRKLRKLKTHGKQVLTRTEDSDTEGLALHTRPEVHDARMRLYVHHMVKGWPTWVEEPGEVLLDGNKREFWESPEKPMGYNISSTLDNEGLEVLDKLGVKLVRVGAVGVGGDTFFEFSSFRDNPEGEVERLKNLLEKLEIKGIFVVITLERRVASVETWGFIAKEVRTLKNVVGYDLINEPFTEKEEGMHWKEVKANEEEDEGVSQLVSRYKEMIQEIRRFDFSTPIIIEPSFWGKIYGLGKFPIENLLEIDSNLIVSVHYYEPMKLTSRTRNKNRYSFPGEIPIYDSPTYNESINWNGEEIHANLEAMRNWGDAKGVKVFLGEYGICRDIKGAPEYLKTIQESCKKLGVIGLLFSFRDPDWEAMDFELTPNTENWRRVLNKENPFWELMNCV